MRPLNLSRTKAVKLEAAVRAYREEYLMSGPAADERAERHRLLMFFNDVLGYRPGEDIRSDALLKGPADFSVQASVSRLVLAFVDRRDRSGNEDRLGNVKRFAELEAVDWLIVMRATRIVLLKLDTKVPEGVRAVFDVDLSDAAADAVTAQSLQFLLVDVVSRGGLEILWNRTVALDPQSISALLVSSPVLNFVQRTLRARTMSNFTDDEVRSSVERLLVTGRE
ncbi:MAG: hypothetical protein IPJ76_06795 [Flavobacteriales bacterium]|nr:MAG: hypothetical protein IPJ76_06795 [Flavobacteriales bacterium]